MSRKESFEIDQVEETQPDGTIAVRSLHQISFDDLVASAPSQANNLAQYVSTAAATADLIEPEDLVGQEFLIMGIHLNEGDYGGDFISIECRLRDGRFIVFNDGSTGIFQQLGNGDPEEIAKIPLPMHVPHGLRSSDYDMAECPNCSLKQPRRSKKVSYRCRKCGMDVDPTIVTGKGRTMYLDTRS